MRLVRLAAHADVDVVVVHTDPELQQVMGLFGPARYDREHRAYLVHRDHLDALKRHLGRNRAHVVDETPSSSSHPSGPLPECRHCGQPARRNAQPANCPACGSRWEPTVFTETPGEKPWEAHQTCAGCGTQQRGKFAYCARCGTPIPTAPRKPPITARSYLNEPVTFAECIADTVEQLATTHHREETA